MIQIDQLCAGSSSGFVARPAALSHLTCSDWRCCCCPLQVSPYIAAVLHTLEQAGLRESVTDVDVAPGEDGDLQPACCLLLLLAFAVGCCCWLRLKAFFTCQAALVGCHSLNTASLPACPSIIMP
jgi:hypothetical protein